MAGPLDGIRIVDSGYGWRHGGGRDPRHWGADVIKIEPPTVTPAVCSAGCWASIST